jgi:hypothetical protein
MDRLLYGIFRVRNARQKQTIAVFTLRHIADFSH